MISTEYSLLSVPKIQFIRLASIYDIVECHINQKEWLVSEFWPCSWCCLKLEQTVLTGLLICLLIWEGHIQLFETLKIVLYSQEPVPQYTFSFKEICWELVEIQKLQYAYRGSVFTRSCNDLCKDLYICTSQLMTIWAFCEMLLIFQIYETFLYLTQITILDYVTEPMVRCIWGQWHTIKWD